MAEAKDKVVFNYYIKFSTIYKLHKVKKKNNNQETDNTFYHLSVGFRVRVVVAEFIKGL